MPSLSGLDLPHSALDADALDICRRLHDAGFATYLVGGCVRDALLGRSPKDFDIGTAATPSQVRRLFRNSRLIGRRFRLVHVHIGPKILEVSTFRGSGDEECEPDEHSADDDGFIRRANVFGRPEEDARSRDFTINGLFYDPAERQVIDHVGGRADIDRRVLRTIGDPVQRFREDPVRILRAVKFAARLGFSIDERTREAMASVSADLAKCPVARVTEELYRIAESGHASTAVALMAERRVLARVMPELAAAIGEHGPAYFRHLDAMDRTVRAHGGLPREYVLSLLFWPVAERFLNQESDDPATALEDWMAPMGSRMHLPVRQRLVFRGLVQLLSRAKRGRRPLRLGVHDRRLLPGLLTTLRVLRRRDGATPELYAELRRLAAEQRIPWVPVSALDRQPGGPDERY